jgi:isocitrate dehydrogenase
VKEYARMYPHAMGEWSPDSRSHVASMREGDYFGSERSITVPAATTATIRFVPSTSAADLRPEVLREEIELEEGEVLDAAVLRRDELRSFIREQIEDARRQGVLFSVHLKATMMKVSDPIIFGHVVSVFFEDLFTRHAETFRELKVSPNNGLGDLLARIRDLPEAQREEIEREIDAAFAAGPPVLMVDSDRGISNFHVPSDIIIDASLPAAIRSSGRTWGPDGTLQGHQVCHSRSLLRLGLPDGDRRLQEARCLRPPDDRIRSQRGAHGAESGGSTDPTTRPSRIPGPGTVEVVDADGSVLLWQPVSAGDIFRVCQVKDVAVRDWVKLAVTRARGTGAPAVFWLDGNRAHDRELIRKVERYLADHDTDGLEISVMPPAEATQYSIDRMRAGEDTISVTGNVLRDYLTDLFPIIELGTSAKMLAIVPLINGGGLFETGAGRISTETRAAVCSGRSPAIGTHWASFSLWRSPSSIWRPPSTTRGLSSLAETLDEATGRFLREGKSPSRRVGELDNRGSHFYLAAYWARAMAEQTRAPHLQSRFANLAAALEEHEEVIVKELAAAQGAPVDIGGYYRPDEEKVVPAMRASSTFNRILAGRREMTEQRPILEICLDSVASAIAAEEGGADRVELCDNLIEGGTTPSEGTIRVARERVGITLHVIIRPRGGDFLYSDDEFAVMEADVRRARELGADGVVFGVLNRDGTVDHDRKRPVAGARRSPRHHVPPRLRRYPRPVHCAGGYPAARDRPDSDLGTGAKRLGGTRSHSGAP